MSAERPVVPLFSPIQIAIASCIGGVPAGCWLMARNFRALARDAGFRQCLLWGALGTVAVFVVAFLLPAEFPSFAIPLGYTIGLYLTAQQTQGRAVAEQQAGGLPPASWKAVLVVGLVSLVFMLLALFVLTLFFQPRSASPATVALVSVAAYSGA